MLFGWNVFVRLNHDDARTAGPVQAASESVAEIEHTPPVAAGRAGRTAAGSLMPMRCFICVGRFMSETSRGGAA
jgi:hypothetical protein